MAPRFLKKIPGKPTNFVLLDYDIRRSRGISLEGRGPTTGQKSVSDLESIPCDAIFNMWHTKRKVNKLAQEKQLSHDYHLIPIWVARQWTAGDKTAMLILYGESETLVKDTSAGSLTMENTTLKPDGQRFLFYASFFTNIGDTNFYFDDVRYEKTIDKDDDMFNWPQRTTCNCDPNQKGNCYLKKCDHGELYYGCKICTEKRHPHASRYRDVSSSGSEHDNYKN